MSNGLGLLLAFLIFGNSLLFWPIYRILHPQKTRRRQDLRMVFIFSGCVYLALTAFVLYGVYYIRDFHHLFLFVYAGYIALDIGSLLASLAAFERPEHYEH